MTIQFVACRGGNNNRVVVDTKTRRMVRSHVMKGRNAGRTVARTQRPRAPVTAGKLESIRPEDGPLTLSRWVGDDVATYASGVCWTPYQKMRIHQCEWASLQVWTALTSAAAQASALLPTHCTLTSCVTLRTSTRRAGSRTSLWTKLVRIPLQTPS